MTAVRSDPAATMLPVSALNQYLYCPRRYWYYRFFDPGDRSKQLTEGRAAHQTQSRATNWIRERPLRSERLGLYGRVDVLDDSETEPSHPVPVERKRGSSGRVYRNDEIQVAAYGLLIEATMAAVESVKYGVVYLYETDERVQVPLTEARRQAVRDTRDAMLALEADSPPPPVENRSKCAGCSVRHHCQPETETYLRAQTVDDLDGTGDG